jgi:hypothetical protein
LGAIMAGLVSDRGDVRKVARDEGGPESARRFWDAPMPWLGGRSPADTLARAAIGTIVDLRIRINCGIPP